MRPVEDLAIRARNWFWYWQVRHLSGLSNEQLDSRCFGVDGRKRHFQRIQETASSPDDVALLDGKTLLDIVDRWDHSSGTAGPFTSATHDFQSRLWEFLVARDLPSGIYTDFIQQYIQDRGWIRVRAGDMNLYRTFLGQDEPAIEDGVSTAYSAMLHKLMNEATPDAVAVLIALFREAMHGVLLQQAIAIKHALRGTITWMCRSNGMPDLVEQLLSRLIDDRVLANVWLTEADWRRHTETPRRTNISSRARINEFDAWVKWYAQHSREVHRNDYGLYPVVPRSGRIDWIQHHRDQLTSAYIDASKLQQEHWVFRDSFLPEKRAYAEFAQREAKRLLCQFTPPNEKSARFYETRPGLECGNLPCAYPIKPHGHDDQAD